MDEKNTLGFIKESQQLLTTIYGDLAQPSVKKVGIALETVLEFSTSIFLPIKLQNEKWRLNYTKKLDNYKNKLDQISEENIIAINPQIGIPLLEKLSYTTNEEISEMFLNLLTKASSTETANQAHPGFISLIERISSDEAKIIHYLKDKDFIPYISYRLFTKNTSGYFETLKNGTLLPFELDLIFPQNIPMYLDNLTNIGILNKEETKHKSDDNIYNELFEKYDYEMIKNELAKALENFKDLIKIKSFYEITDYGKLFIQACTEHND